MVLNIRNVISHFVLKTVLHDKTYTDLTTLYLNNQDHLQLVLLVVLYTIPKVSFHSFEFIVCPSGRAEAGFKLLQLDETYRSLELAINIPEELAMNFKLWIDTLGIDV